MASLGIVFFLKGVSRGVANELFGSHFPFAQARKPAGSSLCTPNPNEYTHIGTLSMMHGAHSSRACSLQVFPCNYYVEPAPLLPLLLVRPDDHSVIFSLESRALLGQTVRFFRAVKRATARYRNKRTHKRSISTTTRIRSHRHTRALQSSAVLGVVRGASGHLPYQQHPPNQVLVHDSSRRKGHEWLRSQRTKPPHTHHVVPTDVSFVLATSTC